MAFDLSTRAPSSPTVFEQQREELVREIAVIKGMEQVLQNINRLNRNLESSIAVGNEFGSVEALWSQFEHFMGRSAEGQEGQEQGTGTGQSQGQGQGQEDHDEGKSQDVKYEEEEEEEGS